MEKECRENWLPNGYDYLVFVGWSMTKRSMTATFNVSKNGEAKLITPLYSIINLPKSGSLDTNFQRLMRIGHTFTPYIENMYGNFRQGELFSTLSVLPEAAVRGFKYYTGEAKPIGQHE